MYYENICRIPDVRKIFPLHYIFEMLLIIGGKGCKEKSLTQFAWLTIRKKAFGQLSKYDLESLTHKYEISQEEEVLCKIKSCFEFWEKQKADSGSCNSNILKTCWVLLQHQLITVRTHNLFLHKLHMEWCIVEHVFKECTTDTKLPRGTPQNNRKLSANSHDSCQKWISPNTGNLHLCSRWVTV